MTRQTKQPFRKCPRLTKTLTQSKLRTKGFMMFHRLEVITKENQGRDEEGKFAQNVLYIKKYFQLKKKDRKEEAFGRN